MREWWGIPEWALPFITGFVVFDVCLLATVLAQWLRRG